MSQKANTVDHDHRHLLAMGIPVPLVCATYEDLEAEHKALCESLGEHYSVGKKTFNAEVWCYLNALLSTERGSTNVFNMSFRSDDYTTANTTKDGSKLPNKYKLNGKRMKKLLQYEELKGNVFVWGGYTNTFNKKVDTVFTKRAGTYDAMQTAIEVLNNPYTEKMQPLDVDINTECKYQVELRIGKGDDKQVFLLHETSNMTIVFSVLKAWNELLEDTKITVNGDPAYVCYKRIHRDEVGSYSRYHTTNGFQTINSDLRPFIELNDLPTCEIDIKCTHPRFIATMLGIDLREYSKIDDNGFDTFDAYEIGYVPEGVSKEDYRSFLKLCMMKILNAKGSKQKCAKDLGHGVFEDKCRKVKDRWFPSLHNVEIDYNSVIDSLLEKNWYLKDQVFKGDELWKKLMNMDSEIVTFMIDELTQKDIPVLTYHDSYLTATVFEQDMITALKNAWVKLFGSELNIRYDYKHRNTAKTRGSYLRDLDYYRKTSNFKK